MKHLHVLLLFVLAIWTVVPQTAQADDWIKQGEERFYLVGGVFLPSFDTTLQVAAKGVKGSDVNLQDDLDMNKNLTTFYVSGYWRFAPRHRISLAYFQLKNDGKNTLQDELIIGDEIFPIGARVESNFEFKILPIRYMYSFMKRENFEFAGTLGLHWYQVDFTAKTTLSVGDGSISGTESATAKADVPLPMLGLHFNYYITPQWSADLSGEAFYLKADQINFEGSLVSLRLGTEYMFFRNVGLGAGLEWFKLDADVDDSDWKGSLDYTYWGPQAYVVVRF